MCVHKVLKRYCPRLNLTVKKNTRGFLGCFFCMSLLGSVLNCGPQAALYRELSSVGRSEPEDDLTDGLQ